MSLSARLRILATYLRPNNKLAFVLRLPKGATLFDIGCGTPWATRVKLVRPDIRYIGLDIGDYFQEEESKAVMDRYIITPPESFAEAIANVGEPIDAVVSAHNIEHCDAPHAVIEAMCGVLKPNGQLFFAFPSEASANFPSRDGCLNFRDDPTHVFLPPWERTLQRLRDAGMKIDRAVRHNRPPVFWIAGLLYEPISALRRKVDGPGASWAFWGFESIIWATRKAMDVRAAD